LYADVVVLVTSLRSTISADDKIVKTRKSSEKAVERIMMTIAGIFSSFLKRTLSFGVPQKEFQFLCQRSM
jgi:hypothetical protein